MTLLQAQVELRRVNKACWMYDRRTRLWKMLAFQKSTRSCLAFNGTDTLYGIHCETGEIAVACIGNQVNGSEWQSKLYKNCCSKRFTNVVLEFLALKI